MGHTPDATLEMQQAQAALLAVGGGGKGTITYHGRTYPFSMVGIGVGGIGVSSLQASGDVYNLEELALFSGTYVQLRYGLAFGKPGNGDLWLKSRSGVIIHLRTKQKGVMLSLGGDAVEITLGE